MLEWALRAGDPVEKFLREPRRSLAREVRGALLWQVRMNSVWRPRLVPLAASLLVLLALLFLLLQSRVSQREPSRAGSSAALSGAEHVASMQSGDRAAMPAPPRVARSSRRELSEEEKRFRKRVLDGLRAREAAKSTSEAPNRAPDPVVEKSGAGARDRTGELAEETRILNQEFMPLVDECFDQADERDPRLRGKLAVSLKFATDEDIGAIVEALEPAQGNELADPELIECVRQSAFSLTLPAARLSGREGLLLTIPFRGDAGSNP